MATQDYLDFDLRLERTGDAYRAIVLNAPGGHGSHEFVLPFTPDRLRIYQLEIGQRRSGVRRADSPGAASAREFGGGLFEAVFGGEVRDRWYQSLAEASRQGRGLRLRLRLADAADLADLPWEYLYDPRDREFLLLSAGTPLVHYLELPERIKPLAVQPPLRLLVMVSSPSDFDALDVEKEWRQLREALAPLEQQGLLAIDRLPHATLPALQGQLRKGEYHIFHFIGHGGFESTPDAPEGVLIVEDDAGRGRRVSGRDLAIYLKDEDTLRLAVLNCCEGARTSASDLFAGVAQTLVRRGIPAVIAMQFEISDQAAVVLAAEFYRALADGWPVDAALAEARKAVYGSGNAVEWGTPVLHLRAPDGRIFDLTRPAASPLPERTAALVAEAEEALRREDWATAVGKCEAALGLEPGHRAASTVLARAREGASLGRDYSEALRHLDAGRWENAVACLQSVVRQRPDFRDAAALLEKAKHRWRDNLVGPPPGPRTVPPPPPTAAPLTSAPSPSPASAAAPARRLVPGWALGALLVVVVSAVVGTILWGRRDAPATASVPEIPPGDSGPAPTANAATPAVPKTLPPPPVRAPQGWRVIAAGREHEPSDEEIATWIHERRLDADTLVRRLPDGDWIPLKNVPELASHLPARTEPPPARNEPADSATTVATAAADTTSAPTPAPALRPAGTGFLPVPPGQLEGYWRVEGSATDAAGNAVPFDGRLVFQATGGYLMMVGTGGAYAPQQGAWQYLPATSVLRTTSANELGFASTEDVQVQATGETFVLQLVKDGTTTRLEMKPSSSTDTQEWIQKVLQKTLQNLLE